ncbi:MAG: type II toxin-antitoxin system VapC family toxin [Candidatus Latescibacteria bacterium]|nr:type II toxin-antitoxin system VapC family toxin [Candidatus Latescibacterota bacterium]
MPRRTAPRQPLLLDTHTWIWLMNGEEPLRSSPARRVIEAAAGKALLRVSPISVWEVGMLEAKGRIALDLEVEAWVGQALAAPGIALAPLTAEIALASSRLPGALHGDPADRMLVATARSLGAALVTRDKELVAYGKRGFVPVLAV